MYFTIEWMIALRYLRGRKQETFISVISWFSLSGIALGVATLIIVMSVMNGFREDLLGRVLGINGHIKIFSAGEKVRNYNKLTVNIQKIDEEGIRLILREVASEDLLVALKTASDFAGCVLA